MDENFESLVELQKRIITLQKRIKDLESCNNEFNTKFKILENKNIDKIYEDNHKLEVRVQALEIAQGGNERKWNAIINFGFQLIWVVMAAYILYKLGLQAPV